MLRATAPPQGTDEADAVGTAGAVGGKAATGALPPEPKLEYAAAKPTASTEPSEENVTCMLPDGAMTGPGMPLPLNEPRRGALELAPSYTLTKSYPASVANELKLSVTAEPAEIVHAHAWPEA